MIADPAPAIVVDPERTVTVAVGGAICDYVFDAACLADRHADFDPRVGGRQAPGDHPVDLRASHLKSSLEIYFEGLGSFYS